MVKASMVEMHQKNMGIHTVVDSANKHQRSKDVAQHTATKT